MDNKRSKNLSIRIPMSLFFELELEKEAGKGSINDQINRRLIDAQNLNQALNQTNQRLENLEKSVNEIQQLLLIIYKGIKDE